MLGVLKSLGGAMVAGVVTIAGFVVTLLVWEQTRQLDEIRIASEQVRQFVPDLDHRLQTLKILKATLRDSNSREEIIQQKMRYDNGYMAWVLRVYAQSKAAEHILNPDQFSRYAGLLERRLVGCMLKPTDAYVTRLYRCRVNASSEDASACSDLLAAPVRSNGDGCRVQGMSVEDLNVKARDCGTSLADYLQAVANQRQEAFFSRWVVSRLMPADTTEALRKARSPDMIWQEANKACAFGAGDSLSMN